MSVWEKEVEEKLRKNLGGSNDYVALATVDAARYQETNLNIIKYLVDNENTPGVYVTLNKPFEVLKKMFEDRKIDANMVIFIDAVTKTAGGNIKKTKSCLYIGSPENLSDISMAMDQAVTAVPGNEKFLFFDSLNTLLIYNKAVTVAKFIHFLSGKMRIWKVKGIIITFEEGSNKELIDQLRQFCDVIMEL